MTVLVCELYAGVFWGKRGPVEGIAAGPIYLDVSVPPGRRLPLISPAYRHDVFVRHKPWGVRLISTT